MKAAGENGQISGAPTTSHRPTAAGRVYAAYGGVYIFVAILWLWCVDGIKPTVWDIAGSLVALTGMAIIMFAKNS